MTTTTLAKHYGTLTPRERLVAIMAASVRGDELEKERRALSAPRRHWSEPDYLPLGRALIDAARLHLIVALNLGFLIGYGTIALMEDRPGDDPCGFDRMTVETAFLIVVKVDGWNLFADEMNMDRYALLECVPAYETAREVERIARLLACSAEEFAEYRSEVGCEKVPPFAAADVARNWHRFLEIQEKN